MIGQTISHYKITAKLGEGGMGAVYRATDTRLGREVALKILPEKFVRDRQRMARFQREAEVLASLNHPHISIIHGLEESGDVRALVLELVEGLTVGERIAQGPIPVEESLQMALEIAQALEAAHEKGIIHRDLKPANVKITLEGAVKVLDFGLAKALETELSEQELASSPTLTMEAMQEGMILGTAAYMSPEQARGKVVDKRTDIWSFGLLLVEMLTGQGMYAGKSLTVTIAAVIHQTPSLDELPTETPRKIRELLERCLRKDSRMRLRDIGDARITIDECLSASASSIEKVLLAEPKRPLWQRLAPWMAVPLLAAMVWSAKPDPAISEKRVSRWEISLDEGHVVDHGYLRGVAFSPDGSRVAYVAGNPFLDPDRQTVRENPHIYLRSLDRWSAERPSDDITWMPFFSPDGEWLGAMSRFDDGSGATLKKYPLAGGPPTTICDCPQPFGASWASNGTIVFACEPTSGLWRVSDSGGEPEQITELDEEAGEVSHRLPHVLPGGKALLFTVLRSSATYVEQSGVEIVVQSLETEERKVLIEGGSDPRYVPSGHLVFARDATLWAAAFDLEGLALIGPEAPVLEGVSQALYTLAAANDTGAAQFAFSNSGSLAYVGGLVFPESKREFVWVGRDGEEEEDLVSVEPARYHRPRLSPDGTRIAYDTSHKKKQIWTYDLERHTRTLQTLEGLNSTPIWSPDGTALAFSSRRKGPENLFLKAVDSVSEAEHLIPSPNDQTPGSWSPDGKELAYVEIKPDTVWDIDIWILPMDSRAARPFAQTRFREMFPEFSPDGRWLAYVSDESGRREVYVQPYPGPGKKQVISNNTGHQPAWAKTDRGLELIYKEAKGHPR